MKKEDNNPIFPPQTILAFKIIGLVLVVVLMYWLSNRKIENSSAAYDLSVASAQLQSLSNNIRNYYSQAPDYQELSLEDVEVFPENMPEQKHAFGGKVDLGALWYNDIPGGAFAVAYNNLSAEQCVKMLTQEHGLAGVIGVEVDTYDAVIPSVAKPKITEKMLPLSPSYAHDLCEAIDPTNSIIWMFY